MILFNKIIGFIIVLQLSSSCSFNFELTSQKTALENQVMGSYKELDDEVMMLASVRGVSKDGRKTEAVVQSDAAKVALRSKQNQDFNRDDIDELKIKQILGEAKDGKIVLLPKGVGLSSDGKPEDLKLADFLVGEENRDRDIVVSRVVTSHQDLSAKDTDAARKVYRKSVIDSSPVGTWIQDESGQWNRKLQQAEQNKADGA